jgi:hypothetical protein
MHGAVAQAILQIRRAPFLRIRENRLISERGERADEQCSRSCFGYPGIAIIEGSIRRVRGQLQVVP